MEPTGVALVASLVAERSARLVAVTGGVAAGKSTFAAALADALPRTAAVVSTDGFLLPAHPRKGFPDSYDAAALQAFLDAVDAGDPDAGAPVYSHRTYDVVPGERIVVGDAEVVVVEGLHLASAELGVRDRFDLVVHLDAADDLLRGWYLARFQELRTAAESDPTAFLHPYVSMGRRRPRRDGAAGVGRREPRRAPRARPTRRRPRRRRALPRRRPRGHPYARRLRR